jgi:hypothetical protein
MTNMNNFDQIFSILTNFLNLKIIGVLHPPHSPGNDIPESASSSVALWPGGGLGGREGRGVGKLVMLSESS